MIKALKDHIVELAHVGHVVEDLPASISAFKRIYGLDDNDVTVVPPFTDQNAIARFAFIRINEGIEFELIQPLSKDQRRKLLEMASGQGGINHVAYWVNDIQNALDHLKQQNINPGYVTPNGAVDTGDKFIVYLDPEDTEGLLIELMQNKF